MCIHEMWFYFTRCVDLLLEDTLPDAVPIILWPPISNACFNLFKRLCSHSRLVEYGLNNTLQTATGSFIIATALLPITIITFRISDIYIAISVESTDPPGHGSGSVPESRCYKRLRLFR